MKRLLIHSTVVSLLLPTIGEAGFRPAVDQPHAEEVHNIVTFTSAYSASSSSTSTNKGRLPANQAMFPKLPTTLPSQVKNSTPQKIDNKIPQSQKNVNTDFGSHLPGLKMPNNLPVSNKPNQRNQKIAKERNPAPVPSAPALPGLNKFQIPEMQIPVATKNRGPLEMIPNFSLRGQQRAQMLNLVHKSLHMKMPADREYSTEARSPQIVSKYKEALNPYKHQTIRTAIHLQISKIAKIKGPPSEAAYQNMVKRMDALFSGLDLSYAPSVLALWELSQAKNNPENLQARDALFGGIISERAGWEVSARYLMEESADKKIEKQDRYLPILFSQMENLQNVNFIDGIAEKISPEKVRDLAPIGDKANYAMARRALAGKINAKIGVDVFADRIASKPLKDRIAFLRAMNLMRVSGKKEQAIKSLQQLEIEAEDSVKEEARLTLARNNLQNGKAAEALALYQNVKKDGKNRLEVLSEQTYAEFKVGQYQESLGKSLGMQSPYFQFGFAPDIHVVEVLNRKAMCDFGGAEEGLTRFNQRYSRELASLTDVISRQVNPKNFYNEVISYHSQEQPMRYQRNLLHLTTVMENQKTMNGAEKEIEKISQIGKHRYPENRPQGWEKFVGAVRHNWDNRADKLKFETGNVALKEVEYMQNRLKKIFAQTELLAIDVATAASKNFNLQSALNFPVKKEQEAKLDQEKLHWPFEDEIWEDELDHLKSKNPSKCAKIAGTD